MSLVEYHEKNESWYFTGPLAPAKKLVADESPVVVKDGDWYRVESGMSFGQALTEDEAWRYYLGASFGPEDENYEEEYLRRELEELT